MCSYGVILILVYALSVRVTSGFNVLLILSRLLPKFGKMVAKLQIMPKIRIFAWRVAHGGLPHDYLLAREHASGRARVVRSSPGAASCIDQAKWQPPPPGYVKINLDGAFESIGCITAVGVIARDAIGQILGGMAASSSGCVEVGLSEIHALNAALSLASEYRWTHVIFESDSTFVVNKISRPNEDLSTLGHHLREARRILDANLNYIVCFVPRTCNIVAHTLAN
ncbi:uncharacterized protein LOC120216161 [Hibiscus syriacus]|uniref:uncharacterized protein LOC120216161 n=1 Tax=Hibiscus syriacus TaxID=106335 RepID=UPI0019235248|nr:uncharacterized protein LOC120216161 [Hibiscus syriacus]